jgi:hypothetical protein
MTSRHSLQQVSNKSRRCACDAALIAAQNVWRPEPLQRAIAQISVCSLVGACLVFSSARRTPISSTRMTMDFVSLDEVELLAKQVMPKMAFDYYSSGAESGASVDKNRQAFQQHSILPRMLVDVSTVDMARTLPGTARPHSLSLHACLTTHA